MFILYYLWISSAADEGLCTNSPFIFPNKIPILSNKTSSKSSFSLIYSIKFKEIQIKANIRIAIDIIIY